MDGKRRSSFPNHSRASAHRGHKVQQKRGLHRPRQNHRKPPAFICPCRFRPEPCPCQNRFSSTGLVLVTVLGVDGLAPFKRTPPIDSGQPHLLLLRAHQVHLHPRLRHI